MAARARLAAKKARELTRRKSALEISNFRGNWLIVPPAILILVNCMSLRVTLQEAQQNKGRDRHFQAILPLRGKIIKC